MGKEFISIGSSFVAWHPKHSGAFLYYLGHRLRLVPFLLRGGDNV
jgi:hypothetical protein